MPVDKGTHEQRPFSANITLAADPGVETAIQLFREQLGGKPAIRCVQFQGIGRYQITFSSSAFVARAVETGLKHSNVVNPIVPFSSPLTWLTVRGAPYEMQKSRINNVLADFGTISYHEYEFPTTWQGWSNGNRKIKIDMKTKIPNLMKVGPYVLTIAYKDVEFQCRRCWEVGHMAKDCKGANKCFFCNEEGHLARNCPAKVLEDPERAKTGDEGGQGNLRREAVSYADLFITQAPTVPTPERPKETPRPATDEEGFTEVRRSPGRSGATPTTPKPVDGRAIVTSGRYAVLTDESGELNVFKRSTIKPPQENEGKNTERKESVGEEEKGSSKTKAKRLRNSNSQSPKKRSRALSTGRSNKEKDSKTGEKSQSKQTTKASGNQNNNTQRSSSQSRASTAHNISDDDNDDSLFFPFVTPTKNLPKDPTTSGANDEANNKGSPAACPPRDPRIAAANARLTQMSSAHVTPVNIGNAAGTSAVKCHQGVAPVTSSSATCESTNATDGSTSATDRSTLLTTGDGTKEMEDDELFQGDATDATLQASRPSGKFWKMGLFGSH